MKRSTGTGAALALILSMPAACTSEPAAPTGPGVSVPAGVLPFITVVRTGGWDHADDRLTVDATGA